ncbi:MAG TPA: hypothetical protein VJM15_04450 [Sphingomicrobium sp.]|nr:hypothetical protein [Sphingomicrobium sp.]
MSKKLEATMRGGSVFVLGLAFAAQAVAEDQPPPAASESTIVVEGSRVPKKQVDEFVRSLTIAPSLGQIARFHWSVCPAVLGLPDRQNRQIEQRMRAVASAAAIPVGKADCVANSIVIVTDDRRALIEGLARKYPSYFHNVVSVKSLIDRPGHAVAWHVEGFVDAEGQAALGSSRQLGGSVGPPGSHVPVTESTSGGRLHTQTARQFIAGVLVLDRQGLSGLTTTQVADYAAMRLFARTDPVKLKATATATILKVLDIPMGSPTPVTLTAWDLGYLKALYASDARQLAQQQRGEMRDMLAKDVVAGRDRK